MPLLNTTPVAESARTSGSILYHKQRPCQCLLLQGWTTALMPTCQAVQVSSLKPKTLLR